MKGTPAERFFVWSVGAVSMALMFFYTQSLIPFNDVSVVRQWVESIIPSVLVGCVGIYVGYLAVTKRR
jgi:hypothetical protein